MAKSPRDSSSKTKDEEEERVVSSRKGTGTPTPEDKVAAADAPVIPTVPPKVQPDFVRGASPAERKAAVEAVADPILASAPWKRKKLDAPVEPKPASKPREKVIPMAMSLERPANLPTGGKRTVLLDTNALMMQFQFHVDIERELRRIMDFAYEVAVPSIVVEELETIAKEGLGKDAHEARMALELAKTFKVVDAPGEGDTGILRLAVNLNAIVVTNDKILRARLRAKDVPAVYMRSKAFLTVEGHITGI